MVKMHTVILLIFHLAKQIFKIQTKYKRIVQTQPIIK